VNGEERWTAIGAIESIIILVVVHTYCLEPPDEIIRIISARKTERHEGNSMSKLTTEQRKRLEALAARPDEGIDFSEVPPVKRLPPDAVIGKFYRPMKERITIRVDADVLEWLKSSGEGYQTRINEYLREKMTYSLAHKKHR
jgi:uncharacterized protein (DUF4415 family)